MKKIFRNKIFLTIVIVIVMVSGYFEYRNLIAGNSSVIKYVTAQVERGTLVTSVTGSGQLAALYQIDIKPKVSGEITWIGVNPGDTVRSGQAIMKMDDTDARQSVLSAEHNIATAKLQLQKDTAQAPIDYQKALDALTTDQDNLQTQYNSAFDALSNTYLDLPNIITGMQDTLYGTEIDSKTGQWNVDAINNLFSDISTTTIQVLAGNAKISYATSTAKYNTSVLAYKQLNRNSSGDQIKTILEQSIDTMTAIAQTLQDELNLLGAASDIATQYNRSLPTAVKTLQTSARNYLSTANNDLSSLLSQKNTIDADKQAITSDKQNIQLLQVGNTNGDNPISLQISKNNLENSEQNLVQLQNALSDYTIVAPFNGTIASVSVKKGDTASGAVATIVSDQKYAQATFNETDVVSIKVGQKATITFDALPDLTLTGKVSEVDPVGTVSQGVVSYNVQVALDDTSNTSIKPGMSDTVGIIVNTKPDVLLVPNSAITTQQNNSYVQLMGADGKPVQTQVVAGSSNDTSTEIVSGLKEGDTIVTKTVASTAAQTQTQARQGAGGLGIPGLGGFGR